MMSDFPSPVQGFTSGYQSAQDNQRQALLDKANQLAEQHRQALASQGILIKQLKDENTKQYQQGTLDAKTTAQNAKDKQNDIVNQRKSAADNILAVTRLGRLGVTQRSEIDRGARDLMKQGASTGDVMNYQEAVGQMMRSAYGDKLNVPDDHLAAPPPDASGNATANGGQTLGQMYGAPNLRTPDMNTASGDSNAPAAGIPPIAAGGMVGPGGAMASPTLNTDMSGALTMPVPGGAQGGAPATAGQPPPANPLTMPMPTGNTPPLPVMGPQQSQAGGVPPSAPPASVAPPTGGTVAAMQQQIGQNQALPPLTMNTPQGPVGAAQPQTADAAGGGFVLPLALQKLRQAQAQQELTEARTKTDNALRDKKVDLATSRDYLNKAMANWLDKSTAPRIAELNASADFKAAQTAYENFLPGYMTAKETFDHAFKTDSEMWDRNFKTQKLALDRDKNDQEARNNLQKQIPDMTNRMDDIHKQADTLRKERAQLQIYAIPPAQGGVTPPLSPDNGGDANKYNAYANMKAYASGRLVQIDNETKDLQSKYKDVSSQVNATQGLLLGNARILNPDQTTNKAATNRMQNYTPRPSALPPPPAGMPPYTPPGQTLAVPTRVHPITPGRGTANKPVGMTPDQFLKKKPPPPPRGQ